MLRIVLILFAFLVLTSPSQADLKVEYRISKVQGLIDFVLAASGDPYHAPVFAELFKSSSYNNPSHQELLKQLEDLKPQLNRSLDYKSSVPSRRMGTQILNLILTQSLYSKNLDELSQRTLGLLPVSEHEKFLSILRKFEPVYEQLVWKDNHAELNETRKKLEGLSKKVRLDQMFESAEAFYRVSWPEGVPFVIGLYPVPYLKGVKNIPVSLSLGSVEVHGVRTGLENPDINESFAAIFHELCHSLYDAQTDEFMKQFEKYFVDSKSPYKHHTYQWINEALATALGNGWAYEMASGKVDEGPWYSHSTINRFAKEIYPLVKESIQGKKALGPAFVEKSIEIYSKTFPDSIYSFENILTNLALVHNSSFLKGSQARTIMQRSFFISNYSFNYPISTEGPLRSFLSHPSTAVLVFSNKETALVQKFAQKVPFLKSNLNTLLKMKNRSFFSGQDADSKNYIVIKVSNESDYQAAFEKMKALGQWDPKKPVVTF